jgi:lipopolysaccharide assembly outer membrane protein LptD (OstA)
MNRIGFIILSLAFLTISAKAQIQKKPDTLAVSNGATVENGGKLIEFLSAETYNVKKMDSMDFIVFVGHVQIRQGKTLLFGDSLILNNTLNTLEGFGHIHINDADSVHTYSDYLKYLGDTKKGLEC